nr:retrovirus-related Pol polyprotein from transposon TNT 1-94 [Tanacetum cinerariifolium]
MTEDRSQLVNFVQKFLGTVKFGNDHVAKIMGYGDYQIGNVTIYRTGMVRGLLKLKFEKDYLCSACAMGKSTRKTHKPKSEDTNQKKLYLLHMDLCGPMQVKSVNRKKLKVPVRRIRTDNGTEFVNHTLRDYYKERLWQPPVLLKIVPLFVFNMERLLRIWVSYSQRLISEYSLVMLRQRKLFEHRSLGPALNEMTPGTISSGLVPTFSPSTSYVPPLRNNWDLLFQPMFDELLNPLPSVVNQAPEAIAPIVELIPPVNADSTGSPSSTTVEQDAPSTSNSPTPTKTQSPGIPQDVGNDHLDIEVAHMGNDPLFGVPIPEVTSAQSTTSASPQAIMSMMGKISFFLKLQISQSPRGIFINQSKYALESLKKYGFESCDPVDTPMVEKSKLDEDKEGKADSSVALTAFVDADHAGYQDTRRSTSGKYQLADLFTKALGRDRIEFLTNKLGMRSFTPETLKKLMNKEDE